MSINSTLRILIIEDDPFSVLYIQSILDLTQYEVVGVAKNVDQAKQMLKSSMPNLLLCDINLGNDLVFSVLEDIDSATLPIIFITGILETELFEQAKKYPNSLFLTKPFHKFNLLSSIKNFENRNETKKVEKLIKVSGKKTRLNIDVNHIKYIESEGNYSTIHLFDGKRFSKKLPLKYFEINYNCTFVRIHQKFLINKTLVNLEMINIKIANIDGRQIPIGRKYLSQLNKF